MRFKTTTFMALLAIFLGSTAGWSQLATAPVAPESKYDYHEAFNSRFYTTNGNEYRTAGGQPGHAYWQNRADYQIAVSLNETTDEIKGTATLTYTNNSPMHCLFYGFTWNKIFLQKIPAVQPSFLFVVVAIQEWAMPLV